MRRRGAVIGFVIFVGTFIFGEGWFAKWWSDREDVQLSLILPSTDTRFEFRNGFMVSVQMILTATYFNDGNRPVTIENVRLDVVKNEKYTCEGGSPMIQVIAFDQSIPPVKLSTFDILEPMKQLTREYNFIIGSPKSFDISLNNDLLCAYISVAAARGVRKTVSYPVQRLSFVTGARIQTIPVPVPSVRSTSSTIDTKVEKVL